MDSVQNGRRRFRMHSPAWTGLAMLLASWFGPVSLASAEAPAEDNVSYTRQPIFRIPFNTESDERRLKEVQLFVSTDQGHTWHYYTNAKPQDGSFKFTADRDGIYWFTVKTVDVDNRAFPLTMENVKPGLKVCVDSQPPTVTLRLLQPRDGYVGVDWDVRDENLDTSSLTLEYHTPGSSEWQALGVEPAAKGYHYWKPAIHGPIEVRLRARDRADNWGDKTLLVATAQEPRTNPEPPPRQDIPRVEPSRVPVSGSPNVKMVNSRRVSLNYEIKEKGPSGVLAVELWCTQDGRNWQKVDTKKDDPERGPFVYNVADEGVYGFTLVPQSGVGLSDKPPRYGDTPQVWVEVDTIKPVVRIQGVEVGRGADTGKLTITWSAADKNMARQPISLSYALKPDGPWTTIAKVENTGRYVWNMSNDKDVPYQFLMRVEAVDLANNVGSDTWSKPVIVDLAVPKAIIGDVSPGN